jgi:hypothetical protein
MLSRREWSKLLLEKGCGSEKGMRWDGGEMKMNAKRLATKR